MIPELCIDVLEALEEEGHLVVAAVLRGGRLAIEDEDGQQLAGFVLRGLHQRLVVMEPQPIPEPENIDLLLARARHGVGVFVWGRDGDLCCYPEQEKMNIYLSVLVVCCQLCLYCQQSRTMFLSH